MQATPGYELLDFGDGARLERFGGHVTDRPQPGALLPRGMTGAWRSADLRYDRERGWSGPGLAAIPWPVELDGITLELRPTEAGQVGCFPEQLAMLPWLWARLAAKPVPSDAAESRPEVLNLFASTGLVTLALATAGAAVTHVDSARPTVAWARRNATLSGVADRPVRWIVEDAQAFVGREVRREHRYAGIVLDPPSYGHGPGRRAWRLDADLRGLLETASRLLEPDGFVLLTAHTPGFDGDRLADEVCGAFRRPLRSVEHGPLEVATRDGRRMELGAFARSPGGA